MAAKFEISKDKSGKFRFHLKAANGEIIAASQGYETKASAEKGIESVKTTAPDAKGRRHDRTGARAHLTRIAVHRRTPRRDTARTRESQCHQFNPSVAHQHHRRSKAVFTASTRERAHN
jgi:uncharacterized protein